MSRLIYRKGDVLQLRDGARWSLDTGPVEDGCTMLLLSDVRLPRWYDPDPDYIGEVSVVVDGRLTKTSGSVAFWKQNWHVVCTSCEPEMSPVR